MHKRRVQIMEMPLSLKFAVLGISKVPTNPFPKHQLILIEFMLSGAARSILMIARNGLSASLFCDPRDVLGQHVTKAHFGTSIPLFRNKCPNALELIIPVSSIKRLFTPR